MWYPVGSLERKTREEKGFYGYLIAVEFVGILPKYKTGAYLDTKLAAEKVLYEKYKKLEVAVAEPTNISIDGEISRFTYLKAEMVPRAFRFIIPKGLEDGINAYSYWREI